MKLLAISEHYFPRLGGTVNYVHETLSALARLGVEVELWVPGPAPLKWLPHGMELPDYKVVWIDAAYPPNGDPTRDQRYAFCTAVDVLAQARATCATAPDILHVMFGLFVMEVLDTDALRRSGLKSVATVHNVPPQECRLTAPSSPLRERLQEEARLRLVSWKNRARLRARVWDDVLVPSRQVRDLLTPILRRQEIAVIGHGPTGDLLERMNPPPTRKPAQGAPVRLLTVGGYAPHKRQHLIADIAVRLRAHGVAFEWDVVGPAGRVVDYYEEVVRTAKHVGLESLVRIRAAVSFDELAEFYDRAHLYVQPSVEEGFCITALDAAASGLPVIASPAGALARITRASGGELVESDPASLAKAIRIFLTENRWGDAELKARQVRAQFSWEAAAHALIARYTALAGQKEKICV